MSLIVDDEDAITVTTATRTPEQVRADFGMEPTAEDLADAITTVHADEKAEAEKAAAAATAASPLEQELDRIEPPTSDETPAQKAERRDRSTKKILKEIALRKQAEDRAEAAEQALAAERAKQTPPPAGDKKADAPIAAAAAAPTFTFPSFPDYQEQHPDAEWDDYNDARTDARYAWNEEQRAITARRTQAQQAEHEVLTKAQASAATFKETHPDYDTVVALKTPSFPEGHARAGQPTDQVIALRQLVLEQGEKTPAFLYYLGSHPDETQKFFDAATPAHTLRLFGKLESTVEAWLAAPPPAPPPEKKAAAATPKPVTNAPAPLSEVKGGAEHLRSLASLAEDDDDADAYIARRKQEMRAAG